MSERLAACLAVAVLACGSRASVESPGDPCNGPVEFEPWDAPAARAQHGVPSSSGGLADGLVALYQAALRRPDLPGQGCPYEPTCSVYTRRALAQYGPIGVLLAIDRIIFREHPLAGINHRAVCVGDHWHWYDPTP